MTSRLLICCLFHTVTISAFKLSVTTCPSPILDKWKEYDERCKQELPTLRFHCQYDASVNMVYTACAVASKCGPGTHAHIDQARDTVSCVSCSDEFFQENGKMSYEYTQPNCDFKKNKCAEGKLECEFSSSQQDYKCSCDHQKGYVPNKSTGCDCFQYHSICDCQYRPCADGERLAANYSCVPAAATTTSPTREPTTASRPADDSSKTGAIVGGIFGVLALIAVGIICYWKRKDILLQKCFPCCDEKDDTTDSSKLMSQPILTEKNKNVKTPTAPPDESSNHDGGQHMSCQPDEGSLEEGHSDERLSEKTPIVEETKDRSRDILAVGTSAGESAESAVVGIRMKERLKELSESQFHNRGVNITAKNVIVGAHGNIVEQESTIPAENNGDRLEMDMPDPESSQTCPPDEGSEDCIYDETVDRSTDALAVGTSAGESVMKDAAMAGMNITAKNVIVGAHGTIVEQESTIPAENNGDRLQMDMPDRDSPETCLKQLAIEPPDEGSEDCIYDSETEVKQPFIKDKSLKPGSSLQNGNQSQITSPV